MQGSEAEAPVRVLLPSDARGKRYVRCGPAEEIANPRPGDIILVRGEDWLGKLIRFVQRLRYRSAHERPFTHWSHSALVTTMGGHLVESNHRGVIVQSIRKYRNHEYHYVRLDLSDAQRREIVHFANSCLRQRYGVPSSVLLGIAVLFGDRFRIPDRGQQGCGTLIARALQRAGVKFDRAPANVLPADFAKHFDIKP